MGKISLETTKSVVTLRLKGTGTASINWEDGTPVKVVQLLMDGVEIKSEPYDSKRTVTIQGDDITYLRCTENLITKLLVNDNPKLETIRCRENKLTSLNISALEQLKILSCSDNKIKSLDVSKNTRLEEIRCRNNELSELDMSNLTKLTTCYCSGNKDIKVTLYEIPQVKKIHRIPSVVKEGNIVKNDLIFDGEKALMELYCDNTEIHSIKVRNCPKLIRFHCENNPYLTNVVLEDLPELGYVTVTGNKILTDLQVDEDCPKVGHLDCSRNALKNLNVCDHTNLQYLNCSSNGLNNLLFEGCSQLQTLNCNGNYLSKLNINTNEEEEEEGLPHFPELNTLYCGYNNLSVQTLNNIFTGLPVVATKKIAELYIFGNPGENECDTAIATNKNWQISPPLALVKGNEPIISNVHPVVASVLGRGYDISGEYAVMGGKDAVLDFNKLNRYKRIAKDAGPMGTGTVISGEGKKTYSKNVEEELNIKVSAGIFGVSFSSETKKGFSKEETNDESFKYVMRNVIHSEGKYAITGVAAPQHVVLGALTESFLTALETLSGKEIIDNFGTHVIGGMILGSALRYYMRYQKSITSMTQTKTFSQKNTLGYGSGGKNKDAEAENEKAKEKNKKLTENKKSIGEIIAEAIKDGVSVATVKEAFTTLKNLKTEEDKDKTEKDKEKDKEKKNKAISALEKLGVSFEVSTTYTETETINTREEMENTEVKCCLVGGSPREVVNVLKDPVNECDTWLESCSKNESWAWVDFVKDTIIPIYEFVPDVHPRKNEIITAWNDYLASKGINYTEYEPEESIVTQDFETGRLKNINAFLKNGDWDMHVQKTNPKYSLSFELVNIDGGKAGVDVILVANENVGNKSTIIEVHDLIELKSPYYDKIAIHPSYTKKLYEISNKTYQVTRKNERSDNKGGNLADWCNATDEARKRFFGFSEVVKSVEEGEGIKSCTGCLDLNTSLWVQLDGKGDDYDNIAVEGKFKVKVLGFKPKPKG